MDSACRACLPMSASSTDQNLLLLNNSSTNHVYHNVLFMPLLRKVMRKKDPLHRDVPWSQQAGGVGLLDQYACFAGVCDCLFVHAGVHVFTVQKTHMRCALCRPVEPAECHAYLNE